MAVKHFTEEMLSRYVDGDISKGERINIESHLKICKKCREIVSQFRQLNNIIHKLPVENVSESVRLRIFKKVKKRNLIRDFIIGFFLGLSIAFVMFMFFSKGIFFPKNKPMAQQIDSFKVVPVNENINH